MTIGCLVSPEELLRIGDLPHERRIPLIMSVFPRWLPFSPDGLKGRIDRQAMGHKLAWNAWKVTHFPRKNIRIFPKKCSDLRLLLGRQVHSDLGNFSRFVPTQE